MKSRLSLCVLISVLAVSSASASVITPTASPIGVGESGPAFTQSLGNVDVGAPFTFNGVTYENIGSNNSLVQIKTAPNDGNGAQPFNTSGNYMSVLLNGILGMTFAATDTFGFYWGSIDPSNKIEFFSGGLGGTLVDTLTGSNVALQASLAATGNQFNYAANRYVTFTDASGTFDALKNHVGQNSFEFSNVNAVPEPATWAMMILGFLGLGFLGYRKTSRSSGHSFRLA